LTAIVPFIPFSGGAYQEKSIPKPLSSLYRLALLNWSILTFFVLTRREGMTEKNFLTKTLTNTVLSRRSFLKWSAALGGTAALAGGLNYGLKAVEAAAETAATAAKWVPVACWHNCGGRCLNVALVQDGVVIRQKTDDTHPDSPDYHQQRGCARGRSQRHQVFGADRLKYPMKRAHWTPGGGDKSLRGKDEWVRISWDEALSSVASELKRIKDTYGNKSIFYPQFAVSQVVNAYGGALAAWGVSSEGAWPAVYELMAGYMIGTNDRFDYRNSKLVVLWGANPASSSGGSPTYNYLQAKKAGAKFIIVTPEYNNSAQILADEWIPVRPSTDTALLLGMAYYMITNNLQDQEFLDKYCIGFDSTHLPAGVYYKNNFKDYVLGTYDGIPKTPEWASEICGTPVDTIRHFAQEIATTKPMIFTSSCAPARTYFGQQYCQAFLTVGWMTGNVGISGGGVAMALHSGASYGGSALVLPGGSGVVPVSNPLFPATGAFGGYGFSKPNDNNNYAMSYEESWDAILNGKYTATAGMMSEADTNGKIPCDIRLIWTVRGSSGGNGLNQSAGTQKGIEAYRKVDFVVSSDTVLSTCTKYADIVLPATTPWEEELGGFLTGNPEMILWYNQVTQPLFEAKDGQWIDSEIAKKLGIDPAVMYPISWKQQVFNQIVGAQVAKADGSGMEPLVTITADDITTLGVDGKPQNGRITLKTLMEKGVYQVQRTPGDVFTSVAGKGFRENPEAHPVYTASGKLEIYCQALSDRIAAYNLTTIPPFAQYRRPVEGFEDTFADWEKKVEGDYPLLLIEPHSPRRSHSVFDNILQLRKAFPQECWINTLDATKRGIQTGDTVLIKSRWGKALRPAYVTDRIMPGVFALGEGAWMEMDETLGVDKAGATNTLNGLHPVGQGEEPWNTCNVQVEKWTGATLQPDYLWPQRIPIKEA
jgi:anaerobic dimethyl sulfoxide reductase subunit A